MKKGINQWLFPDTMEIEQCMMMAQDAGFDGIELCLSEAAHNPQTQATSTLAEEAGIGRYRNAQLTLETSDQELRKLADQAKAIGIEIHSVATALNFHYPITSSDPQTREKGIAIVQKALNIASILGASIIIVIPGLVTEQVTYDQALKRSVDALGQLVDLAEEKHIYMGVENVWNKFLLSPVEFRNFIDQFESKYVCALFDIANILAYGYPEHWIEVLGERMRSIHIKDFKTSVGTIDGFVNLFQGDVNWLAVMQSLRRIRYDGFLTIESIPAYKHCPDSQVYEASIALDRLLNI